MSVAIAAGLIAGLASWFAGEMILDAYRPVLFPRRKPIPDLEDARKLTAARVASATALFAATGASLGLALGVAGGLARRSAPAAAKGALPGLLLGAVAVACVARAVLPIFFRKVDPESGDLLLPLLTHGAIWSTAGAMGGLAFGVGLGGPPRLKTSLAGGLAGAAAATVVYEIVGALAFPTSRTDLPVSSTLVTRGMGSMLVALLAAVGAALTVRQSPGSPEAPSP